MKYMVMTFGAAADMFETTSREWIAGMIDTMHAFNEELRERGELVDAQGLVDGYEAKTVRTRDGVAVVTDGPFAEAKESMVGYWIVDVESEEHVLERFRGLGERLLALPGGSGQGGGVFEVRRIADAPPEV